MRNDAASPQHLLITARGRKLLGTVPEVWPLRGPWMPQSNADQLISLIYDSPLTYGDIFVLKGSVFTACVFNATFVKSAS